MEYRAVPKGGKGKYDIALVVYTPQGRVVYNFGRSLSSAEAKRVVNTFNSEIGASW